MVIGGVSIGRRAAVGLIDVANYKIMRVEYRPYLQMAWAKYQVMSDGQI